MWNALGDAKKKPYNDRAAKLKADHEAELDKYIKKYGPIKKASTYLIYIY